MRYTSSRDVIVIYIDCAGLFVVDLTCRFKRITHESPTNTSSAATSGWQKKYSRAKNHYFTSRSSTFFLCSLLLFSCISLFLYIWANPFNERRCSCIPMNLSFSAARDQEFLITGENENKYSETCQFFDIANQYFFTSPLSAFCSTTLRINFVSPFLHELAGNYQEKHFSFRVFKKKTIFHCYSLARSCAMLGMYV